MSSCKLTGWWVYTEDMIKMPQIHIKRQNIKNSFTGLENVANVANIAKWFMILHHKWIKMDLKVSQEHALQ